MDYMHDKNRMNVESNRLSNLPDDLIHKILACVGIKQAVETSALSSRWRYIWTTMPTLNFSSDDFHTCNDFSNFVVHVLSSRNNQIEVSSVNLKFPGKATHLLVKRILDYVFSHNVQKLNITCLHGKKLEFVVSMLSSRSLKHLTLTAYSNPHTISIPIPWKFTCKLPALTTLNLHDVTLSDDNTTAKHVDLFSNCANLKDLTLHSCRTSKWDGFNICHPGLSSLTLESCIQNVNLVTPLLKSLSIKNCQRVHLISAPNLSSLHYKISSYVAYDDGLLRISTNLLHLKKVEVCIHDWGQKELAHKIVYLLQQLCSVKFLTLNLEVVKLLSLSMELMSHQPSPFVNLEKLNIYPANVNKPNKTMSAEIKSYFLDGSPDAILTMVSHEEIRAVLNATSVRNLMVELHDLLDQWKEKIENRAHIMRDEAPMKSHMAVVHEQGEVENNRAQPDVKIKSHFEEKMTTIESYWEDLNEQMENGYKNTRLTISLLRRIEGLLEKLAGSARDKLEARFCGLRAEAETLMENVMGRMNIQCNKKPRC